MEEIKNINLPIVGRIQHGEKQVLNQKSKVVELGYFIAKIKNDNMNFLLNRFNEKYKERIGGCYVIHPKNLTVNNNITYIPAYMTFCL